MVSAPPITIAAAIGSSRRDRVRPVREDRREATGRYSAITDGFCMNEELRPATARGQQQQALLDAVRAPQQPAGEAVERAGAVQARAEDHRGDDADDRVAGEAVEQLFRRDQPGQAQHHQHHQRDDVGADALEQEHHHREADQPEHELHVGGEGQGGVHQRTGRLATRCLRQRPSRSWTRPVVVQQIPHAVPELLAARLEMRLRTPSRPRHAAARAGAVAQPGRRIEHVPHLLGIVLPVGGEVQAAAGAQLARPAARRTPAAPGGACGGASCATDRGSRCGPRRASRRRSRCAAPRPRRGGRRARGRCRRRPAR